MLRLWRLWSRSRLKGHVAREEWKTVSSGKPTELGLRRPQLKQEQARVKAALAAVKRAKRNLERTEIVAPFDALIESRNIGLGAYVGTGTDVGMLMNTSIAEVRLPVSANQLQYLDNHGTGAQVQLSASVAGEPVQWSATIARSEGVVDSKSRMSYLVAEINEPYLQSTPLRFGTYVTADIHGLTLPNATEVPRHLINGDRVRVYQDGKLQFKTVEVAREQGRQAVVVSGLNSGDQLIVSDLEYPVSDMALKLRGETDFESPEPGIDDDDSADGAQVAMQEE